MLKEHSDLQEREKLTIDDVRLTDQDIHTLKSFSKSQREALSKVLFIFKVTTYGETERGIAIKLADAIMKYTESKANRLESDQNALEKAKESLGPIEHPLKGVSMDQLKKAWK